MFHTIQTKLTISSLWRTTTAHLHRCPDKKYGRSKDLAFWGRKWLLEYSLFENDEKKTKSYFRKRNWVFNSSFDGNYHALEAKLTSTIFNIKMEIEKFSVVTWLRGLFSFSL